MPAGGSRHGIAGGRARFLASPPRVLQGVSGGNGVRKLTVCADRRGSVFESHPARESPDFGPTRKSAISGDIVEEIRKSGFRDLVRMSKGGVYWVPVARFRGVSVACFREGFRRKLDPETDQLRRPAAGYPLPPPPSATPCRPLLVPTRTAGQPAAGRGWQASRPATSPFRAGRG